MLREPTIVKHVLKTIFGIEWITDNRTAVKQLSSMLRKKFLSKICSQHTNNYGLSINKSILLSFSQENYQTGEEQRHMQLFTVPKHI
jgi:hypothetical protein